MYWSFECVLSSYYHCFSSSQKQILHGFNFLCHAVYNIHVFVLFTSFYLLWFSCTFPTCSPVDKEIYGIWDLLTPCITLRGLFSCAHNTLERSVTICPQRSIKYMYILNVSCIFFQYCALLSAGLVIRSSSSLANSSLVHIKKIVLNHQRYLEVKREGVWLYVEIWNYTQRAWECWSTL